VTDWDLPEPFIYRVAARAEDIDAFGHVNNGVYPRWLDETAWAHWDSEGFDEETCIAARRGMAIMRAEYDYLAASFAGDDLEIAVWVTASDRRLRAERRFQIRHAKDGKTLFRALWKIVCFDLDSGKPARMSAELKSHYAVKPAVEAAMQRL